MGKQWTLGDSARAGAARRREAAAKRAARIEKAAREMLRAAGLGGNCGCDLCMAVAALRAALRKAS